MAQWSILFGLLQQGWRPAWPLKEAVRPGGTAARRPGPTQRPFFNRRFGRNRV